MRAQSLGVRSRISHRVFSVFHNYCHHLKCILLLLQIEIFSAFTSQGITPSRLLLSMYQYNEFLSSSPKSLKIQASPRASTFVKNIFSTTCGMHTTKLAPHLLNQLCAILMFAFRQLRLMWAAFMLPLSSQCTHSVASALRHTQAAAIMQQHLEDVMRKKQKNPRDGVMVRVRFETLAVTYTTLYKCRSLELSNWAQYFVLWSAVGEFCLFVQIFSLVSSLTFFFWSKMSSQRISENPWTNSANLHRIALVSLFLSFLYMM